MARLFRSTRIRVLVALLLACGPIGIASIWAREASQEPTPYVRPSFERQIEVLRPAILEAARRHNRRELSGMSDEEFAVAITQILYNEHFGWLEDGVPILRPFTPLYQNMQIFLDRTLGADLSIWPSNLRPSVAEEILRAEVPVKQPEQPYYHMLPVPIMVHGFALDLRQYPAGRLRNQAVSAEIADPEIAVEFLAANLERGLYRAQYERVPVTWQTLAAWHNQGIVMPNQIRANPTASDYLRRAAVYRPLAERLIYGTVASHQLR